MTTITIPKNLIKEKDLILVSRSHYDNLLRSSKNRSLKFYSKSDAIYDEHDTDEAVASESSLSKD